MMTPGGARLVRTKLSGEAKGPLSRAYACIDGTGELGRERNAKHDLSGTGRYAAPTAAPEHP